MVAVVAGKPEVEMAVQAAEAGKAEAVEVGKAVAEPAVVEEVGRPEAEEVGKPEEEREVEEEVGKLEVEQEEVVAAGQPEVAVVAAGKPAAAAPVGVGKPADQEAVRHSVH